MSKKKIIAIFGKSGAGKDTLLNAIFSKYSLGKYKINKIVSCTTRPARDFEVDGIHYHFLSIKDFAEKLYNDEVLECAEFNDWYYGTLKKDLKDDCINIGVFNIEGIFNLIENRELEVLPVYLEVDPEVRLSRCILREKNPNFKEIFRRFMVDEKDFLTMPEKYVIIEDNKGSMGLEDKVFIIENHALAFFE